MMAAKSAVVLFSLARMGTRKKVQAFVRVKPTDDFAHEMIKYGDDNKVSAICLLSPVRSFLPQLSVTLLPSSHLRIRETGEMAPWGEMPACLPSTKYEDLSSPPWAHKWKENQLLKVVL